MKDLKRSCVCQELLEAIPDYVWSRFIYYKWGLFDFQIDCIILYDDNDTIAIVDGYVSNSNHVELILKYGDLEMMYKFYDENILRFLSTKEIEDIFHAISDKEKAAIATKLLSANRDMIFKEMGFAKKDFSEVDRECEDYKYITKKYFKIK